MLEVIRLRIRMGEFFERFIDTGSQRIFQQFGSYLRKKTNRIFITTHRRIRGQESYRLILEVNQMWNPEADSGYGLRMGNGGGIRSPSDLVVFVLCLRLLLCSVSHRRI